MRSSSQSTCNANSVRVRSPEQSLQVLQTRVSAEFREMPGLVLTLAQAARLFGIEAGQCEAVLAALVERRVLVTDGRAFARADAGARCA